MRMTGSNIFVLKLGTSVTLNCDGQICSETLTIVASQIAQLIKNEQREVILVISGAVGLGRTMLGTTASKSAYAAVGNGCLFSEVQKIFSAHSVRTATINLSGEDLANNCPIGDTLIELCRLGVVPILNENDVTTTLQRAQNYLLADNDVLASQIAQRVHAHSLIILTDVDGVKEHLDSEAIMPLITSENLAAIVYGSEHTGRGGMASKVQACMDAAQSGCVHHVMIKNGHKLSGTNLLSLPGTTFQGTTKIIPSMSGRSISSLSFAERKAAVSMILDSLNEEDIWTANTADMAKSGSLSSSVRQRLLLTPEKLRQVIAGIKQYMNTMTDPLNVVVSETTAPAGFSLLKVTCPLGRIFLIFEARPDAIPQVVALSLLSGNNLILKGGSEAARTNEAFYRSIRRTLQMLGLDVDTVRPIFTRMDAQKMLECKDDIQLVIPRGSSTLVDWVYTYSKIPILAHADGVCHLFVDRGVDLIEAAKVVINAKLQYPAACNAVEVLLLDRDYRGTAELASFFTSLQEGGVILIAGPQIHQDHSEWPVSNNYHVEYGSSLLLVEWVADVRAAVDHINAHSSAHTDSILTTNDKNRDYFVNHVDSASVFVNLSTRFADGQRYGLGAEMGISTSKIHARGPVGIEGLLSTKYIATSDQMLMVA